MDDVIAYFTTWTEGLVGVSHLIAAMTALAAGAIVLFARKGTGFHVALGYLYLLAMVAVNATALSKYDLTGAPNFFHAAAIGSSLTIIAAFAAAMAYRVTRNTSAAAAHGIFMIWSYYGLVAALVAEIVTRAYPAMLHGPGGWTRFFLALSAFMLVTGVITHRYAKREVARTLGG